MTMEHLDVLIVGAGLSGIGAAHHVQTKCPWATYAIFEARDAIGGTWDLFRYPGIRSDSDMFTLGYSFRPWDGEKSIADGASILQYIKDTAAESGIDERIRFQHRIVRADWSTDDARWHSHRRADRHRRARSSSPAGSCSRAAATTATTTATCPTSRAWTASRGTIVHPQAWPEDLDVAGQARGGDRQRCHRRHPRPVAGRDGRPRHDAPALADLHRVGAGQEPARATSSARSCPSGTRAPPSDGSWPSAPRRSYQLSKRRPELVKQVLRKGLERQLPGRLRHRHALHPALRPVGPAPLRRARRRPLQGHPRRAPRRWSPTTSRPSPRQGLRLESGAELEADIIVTATGLELLFLGGIELTVDGETVDLAEHADLQGHDARGRARTWPWPSATPTPRGR